MTPHPKPKSRPPRERKQLKRTGRIKPKKRSKSEFARIYGSKARVAFVKELWCATGEWCWLMNGTENAHIESGGTGRKADYTKIIPLCPEHHHELHQIGQQSFAAKYELDLEAWAASTERLWQQFHSTTEVAE